MGRIDYVNSQGNVKAGTTVTKKKYSRKGKLNEKKIHARQLTLEKYSCYGLKLKFMKEFDNEKKFPRLKNSPPPPHNFSNGLSLIANEATELRSEVDSAADYNAAQCGQNPSNSA